MLSYLCYWQAVKEGEAHHSKGEETLIKDKYC